VGVRASNFSIRETEAGESQRQPKLHSEFEDSLGYILRSLSKKKTKKQTKKKPKQTTITKTRENQTSEALNVRCSNAPVLGSFRPQPGSLCFYGTIADHRTAATCLAYALTQRGY
jgi:hypothetical protein